MDQAYVIGLDFGTDSVRALVVGASDGSIAGEASMVYPRWEQGMYCDPVTSTYRQHPLDYLETLEEVVCRALKASPPGTAERVAGISADATGSTPVLADADGIPLGLLDAFTDNPNALFILWKDHTSIAEAEEINRLAHSWNGLDPTTYVGGIYSSEWFWAKALHAVRTDASAAAAAYTVIEHCDWIPALLTGRKNPLEIKRSRCAAGHKALWHRDFGGYPDADFFRMLHPKLAEIRKTLGNETYTSDQSAGVISKQWAERLGLPETCVVGVGALDAHVCAVGAGISENQLAKVMGTSTCDIIVVPRESAQTVNPETGKNEETVIKGICGQVDGSVIPGLIGYEAGQSAFGDIFAWFRDLLLWPVRHLPGIQDRDLLMKQLAKTLIPELDKLAAAIDPVESGVLALDWLNGRRTPDADQSLRGGFMGLNLGTDPVRMHRALIEAAAFGSKAIVDRFREQGVSIRSVVALGGIAQKAPIVVQIVSDVLGMEIHVSAAQQAGALGAAMCAAAASGIYPTIQEAQKCMSAGYTSVYTPNPDRTTQYEALYAQYLAFGHGEEQARGRR